MFMFHKVKSVSPLADFKLSVQFMDGETKLYDMNPLFEKAPVLAYLKEHPGEFARVTVDRCWRLWHCLE